MRHGCLAWRHGGINVARSIQFESLAIGASPDAGSRELATAHAVLSGLKKDLPRVSREALRDLLATMDKALADPGQAASRIRPINSSLVVESCVSTAGAISSARDGCLMLLW